MIHLFTTNRSDILPAGKEVINDIDKTFNALVLSKKLMINKQDIEIMKAVEELFVTKSRRIFINPPFLLFH